MDARGARFAAWLRDHAPEIAICAAALALAWAFAVAVLQHTRPFGLPLDDAYIYLTYAKQLGRGEPFTYFHGGGYSAGSTSALWPMVLAPFWALGARGHALVWVSFGMCAALYAATCVACYRLVRQIAGQVGGHTAGLVAAALVLALAPFAWTALAGMEVAFASTLLVATLFLLARAPHEGPPPRRLAAVLLATSLSRPEAMMLVGLIVAVAIVQRLRQRNLRAAAWWGVPLLAPLSWMTANKLFAGHFMPNTGVAKSHFYLPGFDAAYWWSAVTTQAGQLLKKLFWDGTSPLVWPRLVGILWLAGAVRVLGWARRSRRWLVGVLVVISPFALMFAVVASSGAWDFHNYRYISPAFPLLMITVACALAPPRLGTWGAGSWPRWARALPALGSAVFVAGFWRAALPAMRGDMTLFAQNATDLNRQVVTLGQYIHRKLPGAAIMFHDAGAVAYYGDTRVYDMLGLVTNGQAEVANNGPGARFEFLERLPPEQRPTHFVYYPGWMGQNEFFGEVVLSTPLAPAFSRRRLIGDHDMQLITAVWDHVHTAERPFEPVPAWHIADRVDVADLADERAHGWTGQLGQRRFGDPTARWSIVHREIRSSGLTLDGGRTIRGGAERFTIAIEPHKPVRLVMRTGGQRGYPWHEDILSPVHLVVSTDAGTAEATIEPPAGPLVEIALDLPVPAMHEVIVRVAATGPYRVFHWFALQPD
ncbi:MAG TPA: hypothetical protein VHN14_26365 [Kofleriaceae bacterium]|jgi:hypothetical protein|nr:hypothetical protein [Kofleriaceae bacterium]